MVAARFLTHLIRVPVQLIPIHVFLQQYPILKEFSNHLPLSGIKGRKL